MKHIIEEPKDSIWTIFKDTNDWNEKAIIGAVSFVIMVVVVIVDVVTGFVGKELVINDYVFNSFVITTLGCFGISGVENIMGKKTKKEEPVEQPLPEEYEG
jgi:hypothetical protein